MARPSEAFNEAPKRRGRPPLIRTAFEPPKRRGGPPKIETAIEAPKRRGRPPLARADIDATPKRRGRPPLIRTVLDEPPKRRGRPPLAKTDIGPPKRRGRPPMVRAAKEEPPKRRGRPPAARVDKGEEGDRKAFPLIGRNDLRRLIEEAAILGNRASSANGSRSELVAEYVKSKHLHAGAFRTIARWAKLGEDDPQKLWLELAHIDDMREKAGIDRMAKAQGQLLPAIADEAEAEAEAKEPDDEAEAEPKDEKMMNYPREVEERAGDAA